MKVISAKKLVKKDFKTIGLSDEWKQYLGEVATSFEMIIWGPSYSGKSSFINEFVAELARVTKSVLLVNLEEGFSKTSKDKALRSRLAEIGGIRFANHETTYPKLVEYLQKPRSPKVIVIDSLQYFAMTYIEYKKLKEMFPRKTFIFISHADGKLPDGKTGKKIRYDVGIKVYVQWFIAFVESRYGGSKNFVIWEEGAKKKWGAKLFRKHTKG